MSDKFNLIRHQVMWDRLISLVEEQARTLMRVAFSTVVREAGDLSAGIFDLHGRLLAQAVTGTPGHINSMARAIKDFLQVFPPGKMKPGDVYFTNDPWRGTGHLFDFMVVTPTFKKGKLVALFACTAHVADIGGNGPDPNSRDVFAEGLFIPIMPLVNGGEINHWLMKLLLANSREPEKLEGDVYALIASNEAGGKRLIKMMDEYKLDSIDELAEHILTASDRSMREAIARLPKGSWRHSVTIDGFADPVELCATLTIDGETIHIDFSGSSPVSKYGINCPIGYTHAYTSFGVKCLVAPRLANNAAVLDRIVVTAPEGVIVNAPFPAPVTARALIGQMLPDLAFGCFEQAMPGRAPAEGTGASWSLRFGAGPGVTGPGFKGTAFLSQNFQSGGMGAHWLHDGMAATPYPSGVKAIAVEITEALTPLVFWRKELRRDSGGAGALRGGLGQTIEVGSREDAPFAIFARFQRVKYPAAGRGGGGAGAGGVLSLASGAAVSPRGTQVIPAGERLVVQMPGGGGLGEATKRDPAAVAYDVLNGYVSREAARDLYKVFLRDDGSIDEALTLQARRAAMESVHA
ncbi:MAG: hydantoinase B/oxoprolinase family protein [Beijerinckiaceae bacterium]